MKKPQARIRYYKDRDEFVIETKAARSDEWGFDRGYQCCMAGFQDVSEEPQFIHFGALTYLNDLLRMGYEIVL